MLAPASTDEDRVALFQLHALALRRLLQVRRGDLERRRQWARVALDHTRDIEQDAAVHQQIRRKLVDREVGADAARADAIRVAGRRRRVHAAEKLPVAADMPDGVDARGAVLAAEMLHLGGERELAAVTEGAARVGVRGSEAKGIERIHRCDRRGDLPVVGEVDQARALERAQKRLNLPRVVLGKHRRKRSQAKCGKGAREYRAGGTERAESWLGHGFSSSRVYGSGGM